MSSPRPINRARKGSSPRQFIKGAARIITSPFKNKEKEQDTEPASNMTEETLVKSLPGQQTLWDRGQTPRHHDHLAQPASPAHLNSIVARNSPPSRWLTQHGKDEDSQPADALSSSDSEYEKSVVMETTLSATPSWLKSSSDGDKKTAQVLSPHIVDDANQWIREQHGNVFSYEQLRFFANSFPDHALTQKLQELHNKTNNHRDHCEALLQKSY